MTRQPLNRSTVLARAVELADAEGLDALSMRRLAQELDVVPMALYKHVADKDDLVTGMVDLVIESFSVDGPSPRNDSGAWRERFATRVLAARSAVADHPWLRRAIETRTIRTPAVLGHMEALTSILLTEGFDPDLVHHGMHTLGNRIWGFSPEMFNEPAGVTKRTRSPQPDPADYPGILTLAAAAQALRPEATGCDEDAEFTFALDLILDGLNRRRQPIPDTCTKNVRGG